MRAGVTSAVNSYNDVVGSMESRVLTQLAKIKEIGRTSTNDDLPSMQPQLVLLNRSKEIIETMLILEE